LKTEHTTQYPKIQLSKAKNSIMSAEFTKHETVAVVDTAQIVRADLNEKGDEKVKMTKEEKKAAAAAKKAATAAKKAAAELEKKKKAEERAAKKASAELEKKQKAEERAAKKAAAELEKKQKADIRAAKKAAKEEKKKTATEINLPSSLQIQLGEIRDIHEKKKQTDEDKELQLEEPEEEDYSLAPAALVDATFRAILSHEEPEEPEEPEEEDYSLAPAALVDATFRAILSHEEPEEPEEEVLESSTHSSGNEKETTTPPNSPHRVVAETSPIGDDDSVECDFTAVMEKLQKMKAIILTTRENLKQLEACYADVANVLGADATL